MRRGRRPRAPSPFPATKRRTAAANADTRDRHILTLAQTILIAHASPGGKTEALAREALVRGLALRTLSSPHNANPLKIEAQVFAGWSAESESHGDNRERPDILSTGAGFCRSAKRGMDGRKY